MGQKLSSLDRLGMRYFIDFIENEKLSRDDEGLEFAGLEEACAAAIKSLPGITSDVLAAHEKTRALFETDVERLTVQVRDEADQVVFRARLHLDLEWPSDCDRTNGSDVSPARRPHLHDPR